MTPSTPHHFTRPRFSFLSKENDDLRAHQCAPWLYYAATVLQFVDPKNRDNRSAALDFRLDTGAFASAIPEEWLHVMNLEPFLELTSSPVSVSGIGGTTSGRLARGALVQFLTDHERVYPFDFLVLASLNRRGKGKTRLFGLIALRDVVNHFRTIHLDGEFMVDSDCQPTRLPDLVLVPR